MLKRLLPLILLPWLLPACGAPAARATPQVISVYASSAAYPWLDEIYTCASSTVIVRLSDPVAADISLRWGEPAPLSTAAYQVGSDDLLVIVQRQTAVGSLTLNQVRQIFAGQITQWQAVGGGNIAVQVWTYAPAEDIQQVFDEFVMQGEPIVSLARLATSVQSMSDSVGATPGAIGVLPRRWKAGNTNAVLDVTSVPVLAIPAAPPQGAARGLLSCLQSKE